MSDTGTQGDSTEAQNNSPKVDLKQHGDTAEDVGGSGIPGVIADVPVTEPHSSDDDIAVTGPANDSTLGSNATGADNLAGGTHTPPSGGGTTGFGSGSGTTGSSGGE